jgi:hypothetical protein
MALQLNEEQTRAVAALQQSASLHGVHAVVESKDTDLSMAVVSTQV